MAQESIVLNTTPPYPGLQLVQDVNKALQTVATDFAGNSDPGALAGPYMTWADTGTNTLKRRNAANTAWVVEGTLLRRHLPIFTSVPSTNQGSDIWVDGLGGYQWRGGSGYVETAFNWGNAVGSVSQSGGSPTGALFERGSNANGDYVRYADGTQIIWVTIEFTGSGSKSQTFPVGFSSPPVLAGISASSSSSSPIIAKVFSVDRFGFQARQVSAEGSDVADYGYFIGVGRWF